MDRERIHRGKRTDNGEWVEGASINKQIDIRGDEHIYIGLPHPSKMYPKMVTVEWIEVIPETVGDYAGMSDINGKMIFEGDILRGRKGVTAVVKFGCRYFPFAVVVQYEGADRYDHLHDFRDSAGKGGIEVVENIHDNSELWGAE